MMAVVLANLGEEVPVLILFDAPPAGREDVGTAGDLPQDALSLIEQSIHGAAGGIPEDLSEVEVAELSAMTEHRVRLLGVHESRKFRGNVISVAAA